MRHRLHRLIGRISALLRGRYPGEMCKRCYRPVTVGFGVSDETWTAAVQGRYNVLCLPCFGILARRAGIAWMDEIEFHPADWSQSPVPA